MNNDAILTPGVLDFFQMQRERYAIMLRRRTGLPPPWTEDKVLAEWRFCNVFREDDKTTVWFRENIREPLRNDKKVFRASVIFRWFNRIETAEKILDLIMGTWDSKEALKRLRNVSPVVTGAFVVKSPNGMTKLEGVLWSIDRLLRDEEHLTNECRPESATLQGMWEVIKDYPYMGPFTAYELVSDLRHTWMGEQADDIMTWANAGPGCARGLGQAFHGDMDRWNSGSKNDQIKMNEDMKILLMLSQDNEFWPKEWPAWEMREVEHGLCEYAKYVQGKQGKKLKRRYS